MKDTEVIVKMGVETMRNTIKIKAFKELFIEKGIFTEEEINDKFQQVFDRDMDEELQNVLEVTSEELQAMSKK